MPDVSYYCPHCGTVVAVERDAYLADKSVTPYPLEGWTYTPAAEFEDEDDDEGVRFVCGESEGVDWQGDGCGEPFYLSFVRYEDGREVEGEPEPEFVELRETQGPSGPRGPSGPGGPFGR